MEMREEIQDLFEAGMVFLERNDLLGFYNRISECLVDPNEESEQHLISECTWVLVFSDVDLLGAIGREGVVPPFFCIGESVPDEFIDGDWLRLPPGTKQIAYRAFYDTGKFNAADLCGIEFIEDEAFAYSLVNVLKLDDTSINFFLQQKETFIEELFYACEIETIMLPEKYKSDEDLCINLLRKFSELAGGDKIELEFY